MLKSRFNAVPIGSKFLFHDIPFVKISEAEKGVPLNKQDSNCVNLEDNHKCVVGYNAIVMEVLNAK